MRATIGGRSDLAVRGPPHDVVGAEQTHGDRHTGRSVTRITGTFQIRGFGNDVPVMAESLVIDELVVFHPLPLHSAFMV